CLHVRASLPSQLGGPLRFLLRRRRVRLGPHAAGHGEHRAGHERWKGRACHGVFSLDRELFFLLVCAGGVLVSEAGASAGFASPPAGGAASVVWAAAFACAASACAAASACFFASAASFSALRSWSFFSRSRRRCSRSMARFASLRYCSTRSSE